MKVQHARNSAPKDERESLSVTKHCRFKYQFSYILPLEILELISRLFNLPIFDI